MPHRLHTATRSFCELWTISVLANKRHTDAIVLRQLHTGTDFIETNYYLRYLWSLVSASTIISQRNFSIFVNRRLSYFPLYFLLLLTYLYVLLQQWPLSDWKKIAQIKPRKNLEKQNLLYATEIKFIIWALIIFLIFKYIYERKEIY